MFLFAFRFMPAFLTCPQPHDPLLMLEQSPSNPKTPPYESVAASIRDCRTKLQIAGRTPEATLFSIPQKKPRIDGTF